MIVQVFTISMLNFVVTSISVSMMYFVPNIFLIHLQYFCWFHIHGLPPVIYLTFNSTIRRDAKRFYICNSKLSKDNPNDVFTTSNVHQLEIHLVNEHFSDAIFLPLHFLSSTLSNRIFSTDSCNGTTQRCKCSDKLSFKAIQKRLKIAKALQDCTAIAKIPSSCSSYDMGITEHSFSEHLSSADSFFADSSSTLPMANHFGILLKKDTFSECNSSDVGENEKKKGTYENWYYVKWLNHPDQQNSWIPYSNFQTADDFAKVKEFEKEHRLRYKN
uniref:Chromo domain-containing protein n=1 Tax=Ditylenchus dipsaci TaxID=166011 RepID=A0A915EKW8_9BILA